MKRLILLLLFCVSVNAQSITVSGTTYELTGNEIKSDPNTYLHQFIEDARERGHDFSGVVGRFEFYTGNGSTKGWSSRDASCRGEYHIGLQTSFWNTYDGNANYVITGSRNLYEQRRHLIYHELGHALLRLLHVCNREPVGSSQFLASHDIMFSSTECNSGWNFSWIHNWERSLDRMFNPEYQRVRTCGTGKGVLIDY